MYVEERRVKVACICCVIWQCHSCQLANTKFKFKETPLAPVSLRLDMAAGKAGPRFMRELFVRVWNLSYVTLSLNAGVTG